jgi:hypothetical protein
VTHTYTNKSNNLGCKPIYHNLPQATLLHFYTSRYTLAETPAQVGGKENSRSLKVLALTNESVMLMGVLYHEALTSINNLNNP